MKILKSLPPLAILLACLTNVFNVRQATADPMLFVSDNGINGNSNREWLIEVAPDPSLFNNGSGSMAVELAFEITGSSLLLDTEINDALWPVGIPGNNPFTGGTTIGLQQGPAAGWLFASFLSNSLTTGDPIALMTIETLGSDVTTLSWGGQVLLPGTPFEYVGSRISQAGLAFDGYQGSLMAGGIPSGDFNSDGVWDCADIDSLTNAIAAMSGDLLFDMNGDGQVTLLDVTDPTTGWLTVAGGENASATGGNPFLIADGNLDGTVDGLDFLIWNNNKFSANSNWCSGDFNADGLVDGQDFLRWNNNKFSNSADVAFVPEPNSLLSLFVGWMLFSRWLTSVNVRARRSVGGRPGPRPTL